MEGVGGCEVAGGSAEDDADAAGEGGSAKISATDLGGSPMPLRRLRAGVFFLNKLNNMATNVDAGAARKTLAGRHSP